MASRRSCCGSADDVAQPPTAQLHQLASGCDGKRTKGGRGHPDVRVVRRLVRAGADITFHPPGEDMSLPSFLLFASSGHPECFAACLETPSPIDFSKGYMPWTFHSMEDGRKRTFLPSTLVFICIRQSPSAVHLMLKAILRRLERGIAGDKIDWENVFNADFPVSFLSQAADQKILHIVWPLVKDLKHYRELPKPIALLAAACDTDWAQLNDADKKSFMLLSGFVDTPTADLRQLSLQSPPDVEAVRRCVRAGAQIVPSVFYVSLHPLALFLVNCEVECLAACMETKHPINFKLDRNGNSICVAICLYAHNEEVAGGMLKAVVKRIAENRPGDKVDWEQRDWFGHDFFSYAAEYDLLHVVWPIVKPLPHFRKKTEPIRINRRVTSEDWDQLSDEDQKRFDITEGFVSKKFRIRGDRVIIRNGRPQMIRGEEVRWAKVRELGRGAYGVVLLAQLENGDLVAVKMPNVRAGSLRSSMRDVNRVLADEMEIMKRLRHKNIVEFYGSKMVIDDKGEGEIQIFMEYCPGLASCPGSLARLLRVKPELFTISVVRRYAKQILEGLAYLHRNKVVHRDLKPENVLLTSDGVAKLTDFGCSKDLKEGQTCKTLAGTPMFIAPEVLSEKPVEYGYGAAADIWSLGCTVLSLLGYDPWVQEGNDVQLLWHIAFSKGLPSGIPENCPAMLLDFFSKCFDRDPSKRWTAAQLLKHQWMTCADKDLVQVPRESWS
eukprot:gene7750-biopygen5203